MQRLLTLVQISDLHIGDVNHPYADSETRSLWAAHPWFDGLLGHSGNALRYLERFVHDLQVKEAACVVVTGDLTAVGRKAQFEFAQRFIESEGRLQDEYPLGLGQKDWRNWTIPGNHDQWPGRAVIFGQPTMAYHARFPAQPFPLVDNAIPLGNGATVRLIGINSDADVHPQRLQRLTARGSFRSQLDELKSQGKLLACPKNEIRVLLVHHSLCWKGYRLGMDRSTRSALKSFLNEENFKLMLTGHAHSAELVHHDLPGARGHARVWESRCGSTTQRTVVPYAWSEAARGRRAGRCQVNSLVVHRFFGDKHTLRWEAEVHPLLRAGFAFKAVPPANVPSSAHATWSL